MMQKKNIRVDLMGFNPLGATVVFLILSLFTASCAGGVTHPHHMKEGNPNIEKIGPSSGDRRISLTLSPEAQKAHKAVMQEHLEAIEQIVAALALEKFDQAREITEHQLGFAKHREAMQRQKPENFPPNYHDLAMNHHQAAENLAQALSSHNLKRILPHLEKTLHACVACHRAYKT